MLLRLRAQEAFDVLKLLVKPTLAMLVWMSFLRLLLYISVFHHLLSDYSDVPKAFFAGARFDLLILGFLWIPLIFFVWLSPFVYSPKKLLLVFKIYFVLGILLIFDLSWADIFWTQVTRVRLNSEFFQSDLKVILDQGWSLMGTSKSWIITLGMGFSSLGLVVWLHGLKLNKDYGTPSYLKTTLRVILSFFLVAFAARGTWTPHHLNIEHAQVSDNSIVNQLPLNPMWNMDKD